MQTGSTGHKLTTIGQNTQYKKIRSCNNTSKRKENKAQIPLPVTPAPTLPQWRERVLVLPVPEDKLPESPGPGGEDFSFQKKNLL